ncbi:hypothetical protein N7458_003685 [Penicillium daleae]|uniref:Uncharacterized protein n=1 Tax=Penicillium daleae TaxID=63821 RepID=A0AAD6CAC5_9EURO|nr:hypothetical protein N7458_003685 [Penicillium daleae]
MFFRGLEGAYLSI